MTMKAHPIEVDHVLCVAQRRCEDMGISVTFSTTASTAYTDGRNIVLPIVGYPISQDALDQLYGQIIHECGHHLRPGAFKILKAAKPPEHLCALFNIVEDDGMERERAEEYKGDAKALSVMNDIIVRQLNSTWTEQADLTNSDPAPMACLALNQLSRLKWDTISDVAAQLFIKSMPDKAKDLIVELESEGWVHRFQATKTPHDTWDVAVDLAKRLYGDTSEKEQEYEDIREAGHNMEEVRDDSDSEFVDSQGQGQETEDSEAAIPSEGAGQTISWKDCVLSEHNEWAPKNEGAGNLGITWEGYTTGGAALAPMNMINVIDLSKSKIKVGDASSSWGWGSQMKDPKNYMPTDEHSRAFANKVRRYIQAQARSIVTPEKEWGKIDRGNLYRLGMPRIDGGNWNKKIFYDQRKHTMKDTCIFVLVDWSGSMMGGKMRYAADAAQRLVWCFDRVLNVPVALAAFTDRRSICDIGYIKPYNTRGLPAEEIATRFAKFYHYTSANNDADAVNWAYHQISKRKEKRKILMVLSDGAPAGSWKGGAHDALQLATSIVQADPKVDLYGIGIQDESVKLYYDNYRVVWDVHDINEALFNVIKDGDKNARRY
jgi:hypothetical protein